MGTRNSADKATPSSNNSLNPLVVVVNPTFAVNCGTGPELTFEIPDFISGGIVVDTASTFVCGYVVDPLGNPIEMATVEMWQDFPTFGPDFMDMSDSSGYFAFYDYYMAPFDLYAYKEGYYPGTVENVNWGETGIMIVCSGIMSLR